MNLHSFCIILQKLPIALSWAPSFGPLLFLWIFLKEIQRKDFFKEKKKKKGILFWLLSVLVTEGRPIFGKQEDYEDGVRICTLFELVGFASISSILVFLCCAGVNYRSPFSFLFSFFKYIFAL